MNANVTMHVLLLDEDYAVTSWATGACDAVQHHFDELDMCVSRRRAGGRSSTPTSRHRVAD